MYRYMYNVMCVDIYLNIVCNTDSILGQGNGNLF